MKLHLITIGKPKLAYASLGWEEYIKRLSRYHEVRVTQLADKYAYDEARISTTIGNSTSVVLEIEGQQFSSQALANFLEARELEAREVSFIIGGPEGLPASIIQQARYRWSMGQLTLPHDLAMVTMAEALYRASTITAGHPYHK